MIVSAKGYQFVGENFGSDNNPRDFHLGELFNLTRGNNSISESSALLSADVTPTEAPLFGVLWSKAKEEWDNRWG